MTGPDGVPTAVFASGGGTTLQALLDRERPNLWHVALVVSDRDSAGALERARRAGRPTAVIPTARGPEEVAQDTLAALSEHGVRMVLLAGYLKLVPVQVVDAFAGRMLNVHPALLPSFGGAGMYGDRVHQAVLRAGVRVTGPTVHLVTAVYDEGLPLAQWPVPVHAGDTVETVRARVQQAERVLYPRVAHHLARAVAEGREAGPLDLVGDHFALRSVPHDHDLDPLLGP